MGLDDRITVRVSKYEKSNIEKYRIDASKVCRKALMNKIREFVTDPMLIIDEGESGPAAIYIQAWNRIMPVINSMLDPEDFEKLSTSKEKLEDLKQVILWPCLKPIEIQQLGLFLQGGDLSERILQACIESHCTPKNQ
jgi:hypothetical protein